jgi:hypothetical protein
MQMIEFGHPVPLCLKHSKGMVESYKTNQYCVWKSNIEI